MCGMTWTMCNDQQELPPFIAHQGMCRKTQGTTSERGTGENENEKKKHACGASAHLPALMRASSSICISSSSSTSSSMTSDVTIGNKCRGIGGREGGGE